MAQQTQNKILETVNDALSKIDNKIDALSKKVDDRVQDIYEVRFREIDREFGKRDIIIASLQTRLLIYSALLGAVGTAALGLAMRALFSK